MAHVSPTIRHQQSRSDQRRRSISFLELRRRRTSQSVGEDRWRRTSTCKIEEYSTEFVDGVVRLRWYIVEWIFREKTLKIRVKPFWCPFLCNRNVWKYCFFSSYSSSVARHRNWNPLIIRLPLVVVVTQTIAFPPVTHTRTEILRGNRRWTSGVNRSVDLVNFLLQMCIDQWGRRRRRTSFTWDINFFESNLSFSFFYSLIEVNKNDEKMYLSIMYMRVSWSQPAGCHGDGLF